MDAIRVTKVEKVLCGRLGRAEYGSIHLTAHHLIFRYEDAEREELWVPYPLISLVMQLPHTLHGQYPLTFHTRTFETFSLSFTNGKDAVDVFESVKELTVCTSVNQLYAFYYSSTPPLELKSGWTIYSPREEFGRMGVGTRSKAWRFTDINKDYSLSSTYPSRLIVPTRISDSTLQYAAKYRSKCRIPALTYLHWANYGSLTRCSQPMVGIKQNRSVQDEKLVEAIFQSHHSPDSRTPNASVYGAQSTNLIVDARPTANAMANTARGAGTENMDNYKDAKKVYLGIDNIHAMRDSLGRVVDALREADTVSASVSGNLPGEAQQLAVLDRQALRRSNWLRHISIILEGTLLIVRNIHVNSSHVLLHCSDGWDRTSQLSALSQLCLDPFYRSMRGFQILVEKDWIAFGHRFLDRCGHLSSEKFFTSLADTAGAANGGEAAQAAQAFLASVQNRFASQSHVKETSPAFHQFLECVRQIQRQYPDRFEFNERFLRNLHYQLYACQYGTFLFNCERERRYGEDGMIPSEKTVSVWDWFNSPAEMEQNKNPTYSPELDNPRQADMGVLLPNVKDVRFWNELYGRTDEEMNGKVAIAQVKEDPESLVVSNADEEPVTPDSALDAVQDADALSPSSSNEPTPVSSRSTNPSQGGLGASFRSLWSSLPDVSQTSLAEPLPPVSIAPSAISSSQPDLASTDAATVWGSQSRARGANAVDVLSGAGVRSMWGKLSSNATAAFSVVQDAYGGSARDFNRPTLGDRELQSNFSETPSVNRTVEEQTFPSHGIRQGSTSASVYNPWNSVKLQQSNNLASFDNPWSTTRSPFTGQIRSPHVQDIFDASPLPTDPTIAHPPQRSETIDKLSPSKAIGELPQSDSVRAAHLTGTYSEKATPAQDEHATSQADTSSSTNSDPLGAGFL